MGGATPRSPSAALSINFTCGPSRLSIGRRGFGLAARHQGGEYRHRDLTVQKMHRTITKRDIRAAGMERKDFARSFRVVVGVRRRPLGSERDDVLTVRAIDAQVPSGGSVEEVAGNVPSGFEPSMAKSLAASPPAAVHAHDGRIISHHATGYPVDPRGVRRIRPRRRCSTARPWRPQPG